jgi:hypothetical protein
VRQRKNAERDAGDRDAAAQELFYQPPVFGHAAQIICRIAPRKAKPDLSAASVRCDG